MPVRRSSTPLKSPAMPTGQVSGVGVSPMRRGSRPSARVASRPGRSHLLITVMIGMRRCRHTWNSLSVCGSRPLAASISITAAVDGGEHPVGVLGEVGVAGGVEQVDDAGRCRPGCVYGNCSAVEVIEMPRAFSISIQSETVARRPALPWIAPASVITLACSARASVSVDLPASGWLMTANVRRRPASEDNRSGREPVGDVVGRSVMMSPILLPGAAKRRIAHGPVA